MTFYAIPLQPGCLLHMVIFYVLSQEAKCPIVKQFVIPGTCRCSSQTEPFATRYLGTIWLSYDLGKREHSSEMPRSYDKPNGT